SPRVPTGGGPLVPVATPAPPGPVHAARMDTRHRTAVVTGANRGLGLELVRRLLARGGRVIAGCRQPGRATALNSLAGGHPGRLHVLPLDVADARSRAAFAAELPLVLDDAGRIDLLINNAGVLHPGERFGQ